MSVPGGDDPFRSTGETDANGGTEAAETVDPDRSVDEKRLEARRAQAIARDTRVELPGEEKPTPTPSAPEPQSRLGPAPAPSEPPSAQVADSAGGPREATQVSGETGGESFTVDAPEPSPGSAPGPTEDPIQTGPDGPDPAVARALADDQPGDRVAGSETAVDRVDVSQSPNRSRPDLTIGAEPDVGGQRSRRDIRPGDDLDSPIDSAVSFVRENPTQAGAAVAAGSLANPVPGDETVAVPAGIALATLGIASELSRSDRSEIPIPEGNIFGRSEVEPTRNPRLGESELNPTRSTDVRGPEVEITREDVTRLSEVEVGESTRDQPEVPLGDVTSTDQSTGTTDNSVVPDEFPAAGRDFPADPSREYVPGARTGSAITGSGETTDGVLTPPAPTVEEQTDPEVTGVSREFPTGEDAVVGWEAVDQQVSEPEISRESVVQPEVTGEETGLTSTSDSIGTGSEVPPVPGADVESLPQSGAGVGPAAEPVPGVGPLDQTVTQTGVRTEVGTQQESVTETQQGFENPVENPPENVFEQPQTTVTPPRSPPPSDRIQDPQVPDPEFEPDRPSDRDDEVVREGSIWGTPFASANDLLTDDDDDQENDGDGNLFDFSGGGVL